MAAWRISIKCLGRDASVLKGLSRNLSSFSVACAKRSEVAGNFGSCWSLNSNSGDAMGRSGGLGFGGSESLERRHFRAGVQSHQQSELEDDTGVADPPPGVQSVPLPLRNYSPVLSGFSVLPNPAVGIPPGLSPPSHAGNLNLEQLGREMSNCLAQGRFEETVRLFEDWSKFPDFQGKSRVPNIMAHNLLLHAMLRLRTHTRNILQVIKDMEMNQLKPNSLSYNFLLRAIFRQRDSKFAERILEKMERSGPEAQPDGDSYNLVIVLCAWDRRIDGAMIRLQAMLERGFFPSKTTYNELLLSATRTHHSSVAVKLLKDMKRLNIAPQPQSVMEVAVAASEVDDLECSFLALRMLANSESSKTANNLNMDEGGMYYMLSAAARAAHTSLSNEAWSILRNTLRDIKPPSPSSYLARIHALASAGDLDAAFATLRELEMVFGNPQKGADREIFSPFSNLRPLVLACTRGGFAALDAAYYKLAEMHASGQPVTISAINCVIQGCANAWDFDRAYQTFETIGTTFGLMPDVHSCNSLLDVFGKTRKTTEVLQIFGYMHEVGVIPDERTYSLLIDAHVVNRDPKAARGALDAMTNAGHVPQRQTLQKLWRGYVKETDEGGAQEMDRMLKTLGYRNIGFISSRWRQIAAI